LVGLEGNYFGVEVDDFVFALVPAGFFALSLAVVFDLEVVFGLRSFLGGSRRT